MDVPLLINHKTFMGFKDEMWCETAIKQPREKWATLYLTTNYRGLLVGLPYSSHDHPVVLSNPISFRLQEAGRGWCAKAKTFEIEMLKVHPQFPTENALVNRGVSFHLDFENNIFYNKLDGLSLLLCLMRRKHDSTHRRRCRCHYARRYREDL